jgi:hypothetical protein
VLGSRALLPIVIGVERDKGWEDWKLPALDAM